MAGWFFLVNLVAGRPLFTPTILGSSVSFGPAAGGVGYYMWRKHLGSATGE